MDSFHSEQEASLLYMSLTEEQQRSCHELACDCTKRCCPWDGYTVLSSHTVRELFPHRECPRPGQGCRPSPADWAVYLTKATKGEYTHE